MHPSRLPGSRASPADPFPRADPRGLRPELGRPRGVEGVRYLRLVRLPRRAVDQTILIDS